MLQLGYTSILAIKKQIQTSRSSVHWDDARREMLAEALAKYSPEQVIEQSDRGSDIEVQQPFIYDQVPVLFSVT